MRNLVSGLTYSRVVSTLALFVALGGGAYAITLGKGDVTSRIIRDHTIRNQDVEKDGLKGSSIDERTLKTSRFTAAAGSGTGVTTCAPPDNGFGSCAQVALQTPVAGRVLAIGDGQKEASPASASGGCQLVMDGTAFANVEVGGSGAASREQFSIAGLSGSVPSGPHTVTLQCLGGGITGDLSYRVSGLTAALVGGK